MDILFCSIENTYSILLTLYFTIGNDCNGLEENQSCKHASMQTYLPVRSPAIRPKAWETHSWGPCVPLGSPPSLEWLLVIAGMGDMAVSNSIGSNVFDILIGLGLPWALQTLAVDYGSYVSGFSPWLLFKSKATWTLFLVALATVTLSQGKEMWKY